MIDRKAIAGGGDYFAGWRFFSAVTGRGNDVWAVACTTSGFMSPSVIVHSGDAGKTWAVQHGPIEGCPGKVMWTPGPPDVFAIGDFVDENGTYPLIVASHDNGKTWRRTVLADGFGIRAIGGTRGDLYIQGSTDALRSHDGGSHWAPVPTIPVPMFDSMTWQSGDVVVALDPQTGALDRKR